MTTVVKFTFMMRMRLIERSIFWFDVTVHPCIGDRPRSRRSHVTLIVTDPDSSRTLSHQLIPRRAIPVDIEIPGKGGVSGEWTRHSHEALTDVISENTSSRKGA